MNISPRWGGMSHPRPYRNPRNCARYHDAASALSCRIVQTGTGSRGRLWHKADTGEMRAAPAATARLTAPPARRKTPAGPDGGAGVVGNEGRIAVRTLNENAVECDPRRKSTAPRHPGQVKICKRAAAPVMMGDGHA